MASRPWLSDPDVTLYHGDVLTVLRELPAGSVDCCVTSPPYWGLRDYGTGAWEGGDEGCDHLGAPHRTQTGFNERYFGKPSTVDKQGDLREPYRDTCGKCGATRIDQQLGLEPTPEQYVERMVEVFREVRRVLAPHGTVWLNLGDSYAATLTSDRHFTQPTGPDGTPATKHPPQFGGQRTAVSGLKAKDLCGIPWRVAFALQADGWYLRSDIIWAKPNPMPESVTDRPTKAHEYVFLLSKQPRYFFDQEAVREPYLPSSIARSAYALQDIRSGTATRVAGEKGPKGDTMVTREYPPLNPAGRNIRSVWEIATQPYPEAHFATFPEELARRCIAAGCPESVCRVCGKARERITNEATFYREPFRERENKHDVLGGTHGKAGRGPKQNFGHAIAETLGFTDCGCIDTCGECAALNVGPCPHIDKYRPGIVLDPFMGSGTVAYVARKLGRHSIGIDLNAEYLELAARRLQQQSLFASEVSA